MVKWDDSGPNAVSAAPTPDQQPNEEVDVASTHSTRKRAPRAWEQLEPADHPWFPKRPACYVIFVAGRPFYVGQTRSLADRFRSYRIEFSYGGRTERMTPWGCLEHVTLKVKWGRRYGDWLMREARLIRRLQPPMNCTGSIKPRKQRVAR